jgi:dihydroflavonol-4-reductase
MFLVTGATGYLGSSLVDLLLARRASVRATVRSSERAMLLPDAVEPALADLADEDALARAMDGCEGVFHLAGSLSPALQDTHAANVEGTRNVLRAAKRAGVRRLVFTSSSAAIIDASGLVSERTAGGTALVDPYSLSKSEAEQLVLAAAREGFDARVVNVTNAYGPAPAGPSSYNRVLLAAIRGEIAVAVAARVGWVLAEDVSLGHLLAYERGAAGRRYVVCGEVLAFPEMLNRAAELWGSAHRVASLPPGSSLPPESSMFAVRSEVYGRLGPVQIDDAQARALGLQPRGVNDGLRLTIDWLRSLDATPAG